MVRIRLNRTGFSRGSNRGLGNGEAEVVGKVLTRDPRPLRMVLEHVVGRCALRDGYAATWGRWVMSMHCDFQHR